MTEKLYHAHSGPEERTKVWHGELNKSSDNTDSNTGQRGFHERGRRYNKPSCREDSLLRLVRGMGLTGEFGQARNCLLSSNNGQLTGNLEPIRVVEFLTVVGEGTVLDGDDDCTQLFGQNMVETVRCLQ